MNNNQFRKPLLQSAALLVLFLIFFAFVVTSGADDLGGGVLAVLSGIFRSILLFIGLIVSILVSLVLLVGLFLAATALYSIDKARETGAQLMTATVHLAEQLKETLPSVSFKYLCNKDTQSLRIAELEKTIRQLESDNRQLQQTIDSLLQRKGGISPEESRDKGAEH
ncbi:MAG: hypothetical protein F9K32_10950 [Desulfobulbaceae bacterium]|nr:MAG: hypothetical protein F9K32_10950 [Desulfobulbaceae bacterium]